MEKRTVVAVKGLVVRDGRALIVQRSERVHYMPCTWELPGGKLEFGETPEAAVTREVWEETGLTVTPDRVIYTAGFFTEPERHVVLIAFACTPDSGEMRLSDEHLDYRWADQKEMEALLTPGIWANLCKCGAPDALGVVGAADAP